MLIPAFPSAYGWGAQATGGRGGEIRVVSNTNDSGAGSFRTAVSMDGPAIIVFTTGGVCTLASNLPIVGSDLYLAGQTARGGGFILEGDYSISIQKNNVILRYLSIRGPRFLLWPTSNGVNDIIFDHLSLSWGEDMIEIWYNDGTEADPDIYNVTIQNCLFAEPLSGEPYCVLVGGGVVDDEYGFKVHNISVHNNLFVNCGSRTPFLKCGHAEAINNVIYNFLYGAMMSGSNNIIDESDWIANYLQEGNLESGAIANVHFFDVDSPNSSLYLRGNIAPDNYASYGGPITDPDADNWTLVRQKDTGAAESTDHQRLTQFSPAPIPVPEIGAMEALARVPINAGNIHRLESDGTLTLRRDSFDQAQIDDVVGDTGGISALPSVAGPMPVIEAGIPYADADGDGTADLWEVAKGFNLNDDSDGPLIGPNGYSNVELFLNSREDQVSVVTDLQAVEAALRQEALDITAQADAVAQAIIDLKAADDALDAAADIIEAD